MYDAPTPPPLVLDDVSAAVVGVRGICALPAGEVQCSGLASGRRWTPEPLPGPMTELAGGEALLCAAGPPGVWCWTDRSGPARQVGGPVRSLAAGARHACAVDLGGTVWCWGRDDRGQVRGTGTSADRPRQVLRPPP